MSGHQEYKCSSCGFEWESLEVYNGCPRCKHGQINAPIPSELTQLRADNARLDIELREAKCATEFANLACDRKDAQLATYKAAVVEARKALEAANSMPICASCNEVPKALHTLSALTGDATKTQ